MNKFKKILRGFLDVFAAIILIIALLVSCFVHFITNVSFSEKTICNEQFYELLKADIIEGVESFGDIFDVSGSEVLNAVGEENVKAYARQYTAEFFDAMYNSGEFKPSEFNDGGLKDYIYNYIRSFEPETSDADLQEIYEMVSKNVENSVKYIPGIVEKLIPSVNKLVISLDFLRNIEILLYVLFVAIVVMNILISDREKYLDTLYGLLGTLFCFLATIFIPLFMVSMYNIPSKLVLEESVLLQLIEGINSLVFVNTTIVIGIVFAIITVMLVTVSILLAKRKYKEIQKNS